MLNWDCHARVHASYHDVFSTFACKFGKEGYGVTPPVQNSAISNVAVWRMVERDIKDNEVRPSGYDVPGLVGMSNDAVLLARFVSGFARPRSGFHGVDPQVTPNVAFLDGHEGTLFTSIL